MALTADGLYFETPQFSFRHGKNSAREAELSPRRNAQQSDTEAVFIARYRAVLHHIVIECEHGERPFGIIMAVANADVGGENKVGKDFA